MVSAELICTGNKNHKQDRKKRKRYEDIDSFREGMHVSDVYLCKNKQIALTKNGKEYGNLVLQDKTGTVDAKIWDLGSPGVGNFETLDYVYVDADVTMFMGAKQRT